MKPYWNEQDFEVFNTPGLDARMSALAEFIRPKFEELGTEFSLFFSGKTGDEFFPHVAKHMRRTVNPPNDSWVAFAPYKRGYKAVPHFQIGMWESHIFVILAVIYEAPNKTTMAGNLLHSDVLENLPGNFVVSGDHMKPQSDALSQLGDEGIEKLLIRLRDVKKGEFVIGRHLTREQAASLNKEQFLQFAGETFDALLPVYNDLLQPKKEPVSR
ncbi:hypothetical protein BBH88_08980 [Planococcus antarcticus DSM 14505]|uniref:UPF0637 protein BBH88_08980 n=1 Tax=Planococcus antarcticus DSM 14505 TaxID=1185653 RepID=A0ABN4REJ0_9BACL|nr:DUF1054 domain-containing protein [Planococcus antarcticus]ANU10429.1 hypothetical protein BBH88_08980 [Planococcus antarcticus DSM 14505]